MRLATFLLTAALACSGAQAQTGPTLDAVKTRGTLVCGVSEGLPGFSMPDAGGRWRGFDVDFCRALAAAIFDDPDKVRYVALDAVKRFAALQAGEIDVLSRNSTWTLEREAELGLSFAATTFYDGQGFMVRSALNVMSPLELVGRRICVQGGTTTEQNLLDYVAANRLKVEITRSTSLPDLVAAYDGGRCEVLTSDTSQLHALRIRLAEPESHVVLPDVISKEPLGPVVRQNDPHWFALVKWTHFAMINAEELGVSSKTIDQAMRSEKPAVARLVGREGASGEKLGLTRDWAARIVRHVGHYGEVFERNVGTETKLAIPRGMNQIWNAGGIQYAPPIR
jgi:general L-amino acid transport system substrate-binding protein